MAVADTRVRNTRVGENDPLEHVAWRHAIPVGLAQALALIPGTSRSGITITIGLFSGLDRATAARFSFMLGIPLTAGAAALKSVEMVRGGVPGGETGALLTAFFAAFASGWVAVWFLVTYLQRATPHARVGRIIRARSRTLMYHLLLI